MTGSARKQWYWALLFAPLALGWMKPLAQSRHKATENQMVHISWVPSNVLGLCRAGIDACASKKRPRLPGGHSQENNWLVKGANVSRVCLA